jgi:hypothetical protein
VTEELVLLYCEALKEIKPEILHRAFLGASKRSKFRPTPAEIREAALIEIEKSRPGFSVSWPEVSQQEREEALSESEYQKLRAKILMVK